MKVKKKLEGVLITDLSQPGQSAPEDVVIFQRHLEAVISNLSDFQCYEFHYDKSDA